MLDTSAFTVKVWYASVPVSPLTNAALEQAQHPEWLIAHDGGETPITEAGRCACADPSTGLWEERLCPTMIREALVFLKQQVNEYLKSISGHDGTQPDLVGFVGGDNMSPLTFPSGTISVLLINMEEETTLRAPDLYRRTTVSGVQQTIQPDIRLNLYVLFVARYPQYEDALQALSRVIRYFQQHRLFTQTDAPALSENIERLLVELITLPFAQQNEVWSALGVAYHPSVLYKVKVVFQDEDVELTPVVAEKEARISP